MGDVDIHKGPFNDPLRVTEQLNCLETGKNISKRSSRTRAKVGGETADRCTIFDRGLKSVFFKSEW